MKNFARYFYHLLKNIILKNYRYFRLTGNVAGTIYFYDRDRKNVFSIKSRGLIDSITANQIYSNNEYNFSFIGRRDQVFDLYNNAVLSGKVPVIIDCGANIGASSQYFSREFPRARIIAIEPDEDNFKMAKINCRDLEHVEVLNEAIGSTPGFVHIDNEDADYNAFQVIRTDDQKGISVRTIPDILAGLTDYHLLIVKIDIEGFEQDLFSSNLSWIDQCDVLVVELHDWMLPGRASSANFISAIAGRDRDFLFKGESVFSIRNARA